MGILLQGTCRGRPDTSRARSDLRDSEAANLDCRRTGVRARVAKCPARRARERSRTSASECLFPTRPVPIVAVCLPGPPALETRCRQRSSQVWLGRRRELRREDCRIGWSAPTPAATRHPRGPRRGSVECDHRQFLQGIRRAGIAPVRAASGTLKACRSVKVRRLFFVFADKHRHTWRKNPDASRIDFGFGPRV